MSNITMESIIEQMKNKEKILKSESRGLRNLLEDYKCDSATKEFISNKLTEKQIESNNIKTALEKASQQDRINEALHSFKELGGK